MTESSQPADLGVPTIRPGRPEPKNPRRMTLIHALLFALAIVVAIVTSKLGWAQWNFFELGIMTALAVVSELIAVELPSGLLTIACSFLALVLAAVLLGGA